MSTFFNKNRLNDIAWNVNLSNTPLDSFLACSKRFYLKYDKIVWCLKLLCGHSTTTCTCVCASGLILLSIISAKLKVISAVKKKWMRNVYFFLLYFIYLYEKFWISIIFRTLQSSLYCPLNQKH